MLLHNLICQHKHSLLQPRFSTQPDSLSDLAAKRRFGQKREVLSKAKTFVLFFLRKTLQHI